MECDINSARIADVYLVFWWQHCLKVGCVYDVSVILCVSILTVNE
jgi:hypothetical protein